MKVGFVLLHPFSFNKTKSLATTVRVRELATRLSKMGVESYVFTPYEKSYKTPDGIHVVSLDNLGLRFGLSGQIYDISRRVYHQRPLNKAFIRYYLRSTLKGSARPFSKLADLLNKYEIDLIQAVQDNAALLALGARDYVDLPLAVDMHTVWPEEAAAMGEISQNSYEYKILQEVEQRILQEANLILVLGEEMQKNVLSNYEVDRRKVIIIEPGAKPLVDAVPERARPHKIIYSGIVSYRKNFRLLLDALPKVCGKYHDAILWATKKGDLLKWASSYIKKNNIRNLAWYWFSEPSQLYDFMKQCHVGVVTNERTTANMMDMPSKLFDYMSLGLPVITNSIGGWTELVDRYKIGLTTESTAESLSEGILRLLEDSELAQECGTNGIRLVKDRFNWDISARRLHIEYSKLVD
jgi:glycosyltransferase involved in cell wall biosynthesis